VKIILDKNTEVRLKAALSGAGAQTKSEKGRVKKIMKFGGRIGKELIGAAKENVLGIQYCTIEFNIDEGAQSHLNNYEYISDESDNSNQVFEMDSDDRTSFLKMLIFSRSHNNVKIKFANFRTYEYVVLSGNIDQLFNLGKK
jgi:hypothetical protein